MPRHSLSPGIRVGLVAGAATAGALVGFGLRAGTILEPFARLGTALLGRSGAGGLSTGLALSVGAAAHMAMMALWGVAFQVVAGRRAAAPAAVTALVLATLAALVSSLWWPAAAGAIRYAAPTTPQLVVAVVAMWAGLIGGRGAAGAHRLPRVAGLER